LKIVFAPPCRDVLSWGVIAMTASFLCFSRFYPARAVMYVMAITLLIYNLFTLVIKN